MASWKGRISDYTLSALKSLEQQLVQGLQGNKVWHIQSFTLLRCLHLGQARQMSCA